MERGTTGRYVTVSTVGQENCRAFVPRPLPPDPPVKVDSRLQDLIEKSLLALGRLDSVTKLLPDTSLFLYMYVRKEAVLSSQIEGTQSSLSDLLLFESEAVPGVPMDDVQEVSRYVAAMDYGLKRIKEGFPLSLRLFKEIHAILLEKGRGSEKASGDFRNSQNWIGGSRPGNAIYVPPPANDVLSCMGDLEKFIHEESGGMSVLIKVALAHAQFESIHPFLDGNGRLGRLLITLFLCADGVLGEPVLYLSLYLKSHRQEYYDSLQDIRTKGDWEKWIAFFLTGVNETADLAVNTAKTLAELFERDRKKAESVGRVAGSVLRAHYAFQQWPILTITKCADMSHLSFPTAQKAISHLVKLGIIYEIVPPKRRARLFSYGEYIRIINEGTEPI